jgi:hypothetical protein
MEAFVLVLRGSGLSDSRRTGWTLGKFGPDLLLVFLVERTSGMRRQRLLLGFERNGPRRRSDVRHDRATRFDDS